LHRRESPIIVEPNHPPWQGRLYAQRWRLLLLGESIYEWRPGVLGPDILQVLIDGIARGAWASRYHTCVYQTVTGRRRAESGPAAFADFWQSVAFYNYVQISAGTRPRQRPAVEAWGLSRPAFVSVIACLAPKAVLVLGKELWGHLVGLELIRPTDGPLGVLAIGDGALATFVNHPSSWGFSWRRWHQRPTELLARVGAAQQETALDGVVRS
jgi:hypothetical protein